MTGPQCPSLSQGCPVLCLLGRQIPAQASACSGCSQMWVLVHDFPPRTGSQTKARPYHQDCSLRSIFLPACPVSCCPAVYLGSQLDQGLPILPSYGNGNAWGSGGAYVVSFLQLLSRSCIPSLITLLFFPAEAVHTVATAVPLCCVSSFPFPRPDAPGNKSTIWRMSSSFFHVAPMITKVFISLKSLLSYMSFLIKFVTNA